MNSAKARRLKMKLTKSTLCKLIKQNCDIDITEDKLVRMVFRSFVKDSSHFGLTYKGFHLLKYAKFKNYKIKMRSRINMKGLLNLDRECPCPYYVSNKKDYVFLFAEKPAVVLQMLDGDIENFTM